MDPNFLETLESNFEILKQINELQNAIIEELKAEIRLKDNRIRELEKRN